MWQAVDCVFFFFQAEDGIRYLVRSRGLGDVYKRQLRGRAPRLPSQGDYLGDGMRLLRLIALAGWAACAAAPAAEPIRIGVSGPFTGGARPQGLPLRGGRPLLPPVPSAPASAGRSRGARHI